MPDNIFAVNIIHRIELTPEYSLKALGKKEDTSQYKEAFDIFRFQQGCAHKYGLKTTIQMTYSSLFVDAAVEEALRDSREYGDEIGVSLLGLPCPEFKKKYKTEDFCIWMFDEETKKSIIDDVFGLFHEKFGFWPESTSSYFLDNVCINYIHEKYPSVKCAVAACWEEGPKAYHTCNNSWYTFLDGGPWNPWIPSKINSHCPASSAGDDAGIVAIPHLSRDLLACFDGNGSNFGTHPQNVLRGMIYYDDNGSVEYPYLYNLVDQYRHLAKYNNGYSYNMMYVGPGWLNKAGRWECPYETLAKSYDDGMKYYGKLKKEGRLLDLTMSEFAGFYREKHPDYKTAECALWKDILYGSDRSLFWYADPSMRCCLDFNQGGAVIDMRPYEGRIPQRVGIGTENVFDASYPYLIQMNYRAGYFTHYAGAGTVKSAKIRFRGEEADLCLTRTAATFERFEGGVKLTTNPVTLVLGGKEIVVQSVFTFREGCASIETERRILSDLGGEEVEIEEYFTGAFGTTEYQRPMDRVSFELDGQKMDYIYKGRYLSTDKRDVKGRVEIPDIYTVIEAEGDSDRMNLQEGIAFSPVFHIRQFKSLKEGAMKTCLRLQKVN